MKKNIKTQILCHILLIAGLIVVVLPMLYMISTSLKPNGALYEFPPRFFPDLDEITLENYQYILSQKKFYINFLNSIFVSVSSVLLTALIASAMGFVIARFNFPGKQGIIPLVKGKVRP